MAHVQRTDNGAHLVALLAQRRAERRAAEATRPAGYQRPRFGTPSYATDYRAGWITADEYLADAAEQEERRQRAKQSRHGSTPAPARWARSAPRSTGQFSRPIDMTAHHDDRLTPMSRLILHEIRARMGRGSSWSTCKATLGRIMRRSPRTVQRSLKELEAFGYIVKQIRTGAKGMHTGLVLWITEAVRPFYEQAEKLAEWIEDRESKGLLPALVTPRNGGFSGETRTPPINQSKNISLMARCGIGLRR